ncbi:1-acyl-sn-glycerol-3-phosphate acyltransferase [Prauserella isguenensis]|uniref:1-acyl-sn-glycerol-3-phosphate acyltransferase n=1 Tax=Prauserella isguenensis TaxID=1470180 RepID=A0A839RVY6_9PSEU|nr:lysophospholipid acyltransferase family protein [Prauserella isguenensis]MBB3049303.1 1-acyl-sn-glycerol-3-phosphate acyltransferase [Prauserella isguenensis]
MTSGSSAQVIRLHRDGSPGGASARAAAGDPDDADRHASVVELPTSSAPDSAGDSGAAGGGVSLDRLLTFLRNRLTGDYDVDEFGFDPELTDTLVLPPLKLLYDKWFRVGAVGAGHLPADGGALLVGNHSGVLPIDSIMTALAVHEQHPQRRHLRMLGADLVFKTPVLGTLARKSGQTLACNPDAERLLRAGELVGVWPEGFKGVGKPFSARYKLQRFGRGGFASAAIRAGVPIIPVAVVGAEEIYPKIGDIKPLARLLGLPYFPVTPFFPLLGPLGAVPLPTKWTIEFGEPILTDAYEPEAADDPMRVFNLNDQVREAIQQMLYRRLARRRNIFSG